MTPTEILCVSVCDAVIHLDAPCQVRLRYLSYSPAPFKRYYMASYSWFPRIWEDGQVITVMISPKNDLWSQYKVLSAKIINIFKGQKEGTGKENYLLHLFPKFALVQQ
jgi:hypothetical protein